MIGNRRALIVVDMQRDFVDADGALYVPQAELLVEPIRVRAEHYDYVIGTCDQHPLNHYSFQVNGGQWPEHCVRGTPGADVVTELRELMDTIVSKGSDPMAHGDESGFQTGYLDDFLKAARVERVTICGVASEVCVRATALSARRAGYPTSIALDSVAGIKQRDVSLAWREVAKAGVSFS